MKTYSYRKLRGRIVEKFVTITEFARHIGASKVSVSYKLNNRIGFSKRDIEVWSEALDIPLEQYGEYFFT